jgi:hypothetical protein
MYLDVADAKSLPNGWSRNAQFSLAVINQLDSKHSLRKGISKPHRVSTCLEVLTLV